MKRSVKLLSLLLVLAVALGFAGYGASGKSASTAPAAAYGSYASYDTAYSEAADYVAEAPMAPMPEPAAAPAEAMSTGLSNQNQTSSAADMSEKIIYNAEVTLETTEFDDALEKIGALVRELGGYIESTSVSGSNYSAISKGNTGVRSAYFTIRIPSENFSQLTGTLSQLGNVPSSRTYSRNVTREYYDVQSRLDAYRTQEKCLLEMLSIAETVEDMLSIQRELTEVQYQLDSLTGTLRYYDNQVSYSTVDLSVKEVREYTPEPTIKLTYWERMARGFRTSLKETGEFFTDLFLWLVTSLPWLVPLAAVIWLAVHLIRRRIRRNPERAKAAAERRAARKEARERRRAARKGKKARSPSPEEKNE
ncbi:MAG: DUF4349 domain-containing protein [Oscillospiraceae bacterium]|nr:DUF4349 domain-containing protein [Oscillospiraceae bacterium]